MSLSAGARSARTDVLWQHRVEVVPEGWRWSKCYPYKGYLYKQLFEDLGTEVMCHRSQ
jgi:hypothetical protein